MLSTNLTRANKRLLYLMFNFIYKYTKLCFLKFVGSVPDRSLFVTSLNLWEELWASKLCNICTKLLFLHCVDTFVPINSGLCYLFMESSVLYRYSGLTHETPSSDFSYLQNHIQATRSGLIQHLSVFISLRLFIIKC